MSTISMRTLIKAHAALVEAKAAVEAMPREQQPEGLWHSLMEAEIDLRFDLAAMQPVTVTGVPNEQA